MQLLLYPMLAVLIIISLFILKTKNILAGIVALSIYSGLLVVIYVLLKAPDVALAQGVVTAGISTAFFILSYNKVEDILKYTDEPINFIDEEDEKG